jgi:hypothetical protein
VIKAIMDGKDGKKLVFLGVTFANLNRMREGDPLFVRGAELGLDFDIAIHTEKDEQTILDQFKKAGVILPKPENIRSLCPDDDTPLLQRNDRMNSYLRCPECGREFGVSP